MSGQPEIHEDALKAPFKERTAQQRTEKQFREYGDRLRKAGIEQSWTEYMKIMDSVKSSHAELQSNDRTALTVAFTGDQERNRFGELVQKIFSGANDPPLIFLPTEVTKGTSSNPGWTIQNFGHEDLCTLGRAGTAFFTEEYGPQLEENIRLVRQRTLGDIATVPDLDGKEFEEFLPDALRERLRDQAVAMGASAEKTLLTSGLGLSGIGIEVRRVLKANGDNKQLPIQRSLDCRPVIEKGIDFYAKKSQTGGPVVSVTDSKSAAKKNVHDKFTGVQVDDPEKVYDLVTGVFTGEIVASAFQGGIKAGLRFSGEAVTATVGAMRQKRADKQKLQRRLQPRPV